MNDLALYLRCSNAAPSDKPRECDQTCPYFTLDPVKNYPDVNILADIEIDGVGYYTGCDYEQVCKDAAAYIEDQQKYVWHDLKKDPDDVPEDEEKKLVITETSKGTRNYVLAYYCHSLSRWASGMNSNVTAWREIEPFEGAVYDKAII